MRAEQKVLNVLKFARQLLNNPDRWTFGSDARDVDDNHANPFHEKACKWCVRGAIYKGFYIQNQTYIDPSPMFNSVLRGRFPKAEDLFNREIPIMNDADEMTHPMMLELLDDMIVYVSTLVKHNQ